MIVAAILYPFVVVLEGLLSLWPSAGTIGPTSDGLFVRYLVGLNTVVDIVGPLQFVAGLLAAVPAMLAVRVFLWVYRLTPGKFT